MSEDKNCRYRFTVPVADTKVNQWIEEQANLSFSLRVLIKAFIRDYGTQDATCLEVGSAVKRRGRPPKQAQIHLENMALDHELSFGNVEYDDEDEEDENIVAEDDLVAKKQNQKKVDEKPSISDDEPSVDDIFNTAPTTSKKSTKKVDTPSTTTTSADTDDDGFVDPESLF